LEITSNLDFDTQGVLLILDKTKALLPRQATSRLRCPEAWKGDPKDYDFISQRSFQDCTNSSLQRNTPSFDDEQTLSVSTWSPIPAFDREFYFRLLPNLPMTS
jgi:hypothetical protein